MSKFSGSGPGEQTNDGCSVEFYRRLPYLGELDEIMGLLPAHSSVMELGCGSGRLAARLAAAGHRVVGVDDSAAMLSHLPPTVSGVHASIEAIALPQRFDVVLLPSHLINHPDADLRSAFVRCAARHLVAGGVFYLKRHDPSWLRTVQTGFLAERDGVRYAAEGVSRQGNLLTMTLVYQAFGERWTQSFTAQALEAEAIEALLAEQGFGKVQWHGEKGLWAEARLAHDTSQERARGGYA
ncbi:class I SAM-dependent methyltransferase [Paucibacter sp. KBW04]|uniref:class I SAM-dependent methyltransferase n=1 Tax=Paucibacter sp. KBW04 TaxID=2153361 RepID=UPI000F577BC6|nr:class I SAM-dependent methyltransferase [Paucibacter sp. KBW04]RQO54766.1 class I SAM-dependent methyltransferase [Paucibacter sp. KBW04]